MTITLYKSPGERNLLNRKMTLVSTMSTVDATEEISIEEPVVKINKDDSLIGFDYAYITEFKRYYFLTDFVVDGPFFRLSLVSDPLMSFRSAILSSPCIAKRSSSNINPELEDDQVAFKNIPKRIYRRMPGGFNPSSSGGSYVLTLGGK